MREIKFRAWDKNNGNMVVGLDIRDFGYGQLLDAINSGSIELMQYTGLKDTNGKEIYEGDIVHFTEFYEAGGLQGSVEGDRQHTLAVEWDSDLSGFSVGDWWLGVIRQQDDELEVIGNIYENPELLK